MSSLELLLNRKCLIVPQLSMYECLKYYELPALTLVLLVIGISIGLRYIKFKKIEKAGKGI